LGEFIKSGDLLIKKMTLKIIEKKSCWNYSWLTQMNFEVIQFCYDKIDIYTSE